MFIVYVFTDNFIIPLMLTCSLSYLVIFHRPDGWSEDWDSLYHGLRGGMLIVLALYGFAINTYVWRTTGVNSTLIFEFDPRDYRSFNELFEVCWVKGVPNVL